MHKLWTFLFGPRSDISENEACFFLGSRFALSPSACVNGFCSGIVDFPDSEVRRNQSEGALIPCRAAVQATQTYISRAFTESAHDSQAVITAFVKQSVIPALEVLIFGGGVAWASIARDLDRVDHWALHEAGRDWKQWRDIIAPSFLTSIPGRSLMSLVRQNARKWHYLSLLSIPGNHAIVEVVRFYFRFTALVGSHEFSDAYIQFLAERIDESPSVDRDEGGWVDVPTDAESLVELSQDLDRLTDPRWVDFPVVDDVRRFARLVSQWTPSSSQALLEKQMITPVCPGLDDLFSVAAKEQDANEHFIRSAVTFIDFCSSFSPLAQLAKSRAILASMPHLGGEGITHPPPISAMAAAARLESTRFSVAYFVPATNPEFQRIVFRESRLSGAQPLGRAIGLALLSGAEIVHWRLEPCIAQLLHKRQRAHVSSKAEIQSFIGDSYTVTQVLQLAAGVDHILNPGGHEMFTSTEWMSRFGLLPVYA